MKSVRDPLTGLLARQGFADAATRWLRLERHERQRLMFFEVVGLSIINETQGTALGDQLLEEIARWLEAKYNGEHAVLGRWSGSKFVVLYEPSSMEVSPGTLHGVSVRAIGLGRNLGRNADLARVYLGFCDARSLEINELLTFAQEALREAGRSAGSSAYCFDELMHRRLLRRQDIMKDLACAIEDGEVGVWYQPILSVDGSRLHSLEALLRWRHPRQGWTSPEEVVHAAATMGMSERLLQHILQTACHGLHTLSTASTHFKSVPIAVNISPREIGGLPVDEIVLRTLRREGISPERLRIEITEESALNNPLAPTQLKKLAAHGVSIAVDDFGTGYSSLAMLNEKYVGQIKIDRLLISDLQRSERRMLLVDSIIHLGRALGMEVVGEGVETVDEVEHLRILGCSLVQGYFLARPAPLDVVVAQVRNMPLIPM